MADQHLTPPRPSALPLRPSKTADDGDDRRGVINVEAEKRRGTARGSTKDAGASS